MCIGLLFPKAIPANFSKVTKGTTLGVEQKGENRIQVTTGFLNPSSVQQIGPCPENWSRQASFTSASVVVPAERGGWWGDGPNASLFFQRNRMATAANYAYVFWKTAANGVEISAQHLTSVGKSGDAYKVYTKSSQ